MVRSWGPNQVSQIILEMPTATLRLSDLHHENFLRTRHHDTANRGRIASFTDGHYHTASAPFLQ